MTENRKKYFARLLADMHINYLFRMSAGTLKGDYQKAQKNFYTGELNTINALIDYLKNTDEISKDVYPERRSVLIAFKNELELE